MCYLDSIVVSYDDEHLRTLDTEAALDAPARSVYALGILCIPDEEWSIEQALAQDKLQVTRSAISTLMGLTKRHFEIKIGRQAWDALDAACESEGARYSLDVR